jgi:tetratricopeptide (TPR) repeat protein
MRSLFALIRVFVLSPEEHRAGRLSAFVGVFFCLAVFSTSAAPLLFRAAEARAADSRYVGSAACADCHAAQSKAWRSSHHAAAMAVATPETVLGDFKDVSIDSHGSKGRFLGDGERFIVETEGRDGKTARFEVAWTFGVEPLQQYLVAFPDGRVQALPWAWDTRPKEAGGQRWLHLYSDRPMPSADPLHWTKSMQNWNFMCAECHSTGVQKNYDAKRDVFHTSFSEISVGCESCHGPGGGHLDWAKDGRDPGRADKGFDGSYARREKVEWSADAKTGSPAQSAPRPVADEVELCAHCHSRRGEIHEGWRPGQPLLDTHLPSFLAEELFEDDGQMKDEVFNDHSFKQSLMYAKGVVCSDCHEAHSGKLKAARAEVCAQCHQPARFATKDHTGHLGGSAAPDCVSCHMPARTYMVVDERHDHSFRIPRPDLTIALRTPNACNDCHKDKTPQWAARAIETWHGPVRKGYQNWAEAFYRARGGDPAARELLLKLVNEPATPAVARAAAIVESQRFLSISVEQATSRSLNDPDPLVRVAALRAQWPSAPLDLRWRRAGPLLSDPIRAVRVEAAAVLADQPADALAREDRVRLEAAWAEYEASQRLNADRPEGRANLAGFLQRRGKTKEAEEEYFAGLKLEPMAAPLSVNLAELYRLQGKESQAENALRKAVALSPDAASLRHALGLGLIRQKRYDEGIRELGRAVELAPDEARYSYVYVVALQSQERRDEARKILNQALLRHPFDRGLLQLELPEALRFEDIKGAALVARTLSELAPDDPEIARLAAWLEKRK